MADIKKKPKRMLCYTVAIILAITMLTGVTYGYEETKQLTNEFDGKFEEGDPDDTVTISVTKVWQPANGHPDSVKVQLYKNGIPQGQPVILNAENSWSHNWTELRESDVWTVDEVEVPAGYIKTITGNAKDGYVITNRKESGNEPPDDPIKPPRPDEPDDPGANIPGTDVPTGSKDPDPDPNSNIDDPDAPRGGRDPDPNIPKTGDDANPRLWLIILAVSAFLLRRELFFSKSSCK